MDPRRCRRRSIRWLRGLACRAFHWAWCSRMAWTIDGPSGRTCGIFRSSGLISGASGLSITAFAQSSSPSQKCPARISGVSCRCRTWRSCQTISVSSTVPMPPGVTMNASDTRTKWCSRVKNVLCSNASVTKAFTSCSNGSSTRMPTDFWCVPSGSASFTPSFAACISPGPPPVTMSHPSRVSSAAVSRTAAYTQWFGSTRAEPKMVTR